MNGGTEPGTVAAEGKGYTIFGGEGTKYCTITANGSFKINIPVSCTAKIYLANGGDNTSTCNVTIKQGNTTLDTYAAPGRKQTAAPYILDVISDLIDKDITFTMPNKVGWLVKVELAATE